MALAALPSPLTRLIGRDRELGLAQALVTADAARLLTVTGIGGVGKTRFALELARRVSADFQDGSSFVSLAAIRDSGHVASALGQLLVRKHDEDADSFDALCALIGGRRVLLMVDNFEHVLAGAPLLPELLARCPRAVVLVTSRETLRVTGEHEFLLAPLALDAAAELFVDRSAAIRPEVDVRADHDVVVEICKHLDGLPLAIELAAARLRHYPIAALLERLSSRLDVLTSGTRDSPPRHRTMRDTIEWSYKLLNDEERTAFQIGSLFAGGGALDAAGLLLTTAGAAGAHGEELFTSLADKHLASVQISGQGRGRFSMLETIREYAHEQLAASGRLDRVAQAFAQYYAELANRAAPHLRGPDASGWFAVLAEEYENLRATLRWAVTNDRALGLRLALDLRSFWERRGYWVEARAWLEALVDPLAQTVEGMDPKMRWQIVNLLALSHHWMGDEERARPLYEDVLRQARSIDDEDLIARSLNNLGSSLLNLGEFERARQLQEEALVIKQRRGDAWSIATTLSNLGMALRACHEYPLALERHRQALELFRSADDSWGEIAELNDIADIYRDQHEHVQAARFYKASLDKNVDGIRPLVADSFEGLAAAAASHERSRQTAVLGGAADTIHKEAGRSISLPDRPPFDAACALARRAIGVAAFEEAWCEGAALPLAEATEIARAIASDLSG